MEDRNILKPLIFAFNEDIRLNDGPSHVTDLMVLTIKSLVPSEDYVGVYIDYKRFNEEMKLWKYYRHGDNIALLNILGNMDSHIYWDKKDDTAYFRIIPIVLSNKDYAYIRREVIKNLLFTTGNIETLIEGILLSKLLYLLIREEENAIEELKKELIDFSQIEFIEEYIDYIRISTETYPGNFTVNFEQYRIHGLNVLNFSHSKYFKVLTDCLEIFIKGEEANTLFGKCISPLMADIKHESYKEDDFYFELCNYVNNLRKGRINPQSLKIKKYYLPDVFQYDVGDEFYHSLLNQSRVIKKEKINNKTILHLNTKSGIYKLVN